TAMSMLSKMSNIDIEKMFPVKPFDLMTPITNMQSALHKAIMIPFTKMMRDITKAADWKTAAERKDALLKTAERRKAFFAGRKDAAGNLIDEFGKPVKMEPGDVHPIEKFMEKVPRFGMGEDPTDPLDPQKRGMNELLKDRLQKMRENVPAPPLGGAAGGGPLMDRDPHAKMDRPKVFRKKRTTFGDLVPMDMPPAGDERDKWFQNMHDLHIGLNEPISGGPLMQIDPGEGWNRNLRPLPVGLV